MPDVPAPDTPRRANGRRDPDSVYRVVRVVGSDDTSWEGAASSAITELAKTITDLRVARVAELDAVAHEGGVRAYRIKLEASYRIDTRRRSDTGATVNVRRYLVVANETIGTAALDAALEERVHAGPSEFHVLVPVSTRGFQMVATMGDPASGFIPPDGALYATAREDAYREASDRLVQLLEHLRSVGATATGEVGPPDPLAAIDAVVRRGTYDELVISTLPTTLSKWLHLDLPSRAHRRFNLPVAHVQASG
jgi:flavin-binding protein dodecin